MTKPPPKLSCDGRYSEVSAIPKSANPVRIQENFAIFDFIITAEDMLIINGFNEKSSADR
ncbi:MAG: hypothetical protein R2822_13645 [Spirosomataceae bacterium]